MVDWTPDPTKTQLADDGSGRRREWAFRDVSPGAPKVQPRPVPQPQRPHPHPQRAAQTVVVGADIDLEPADGGYTSLGREAMRASVEAGVQTRNAIRQSATWKLYAPWIGMVLFLGIALYGYGQPRGWFGAVEYPQTQPSNSARSERESGARRAGGGGVNHSRDVLIEWLRTGQIGSMTDDEIAAARRAVEADR